MSILKRLYYFFKKKVSRIKSKRRNEKVISKIRKATITVKPETEKLLVEILSKNESEGLPFLNNIIESTTISEIAEVVSTYGLKNKRRKALELHELEAELSRLNRSFYSLEIKQRKIESIKFKREDFISNQVANLYNILSEHKKNGEIQFSKVTVSRVDKPFSDLEKLLTEHSTSRCYYNREIEKSKQEELRRQQFKTRLTELETFIGQNRLDEAKARITSLEKVLSNTSFPKEKERLQKAKIKFREKEVSNLRKLQDEILKKQQETVDLLRISEIEKKQKADEEKVFDFVRDATKDSILDNYHVDYLYHMTEISNLPNIFRYGLLSHNEAQEKGLTQRSIALQDVNQRRARKKPIYGIGLHNFVPMYFNPKNPMLFKRKDLQNNIVIIAIDRIAIYQDKSIFTDGNAASDSTTFYNDLADLEKLHWDCIQNDYWNSYPDGKRVKCSETLAYPKITIKHIRKIYCNNISTKNLVDEQSPANKGFQVELNSKFFFNHNFSFESHFNL